MTRYSAFCESPLDDNAVYVEAADRSKARAKIKAAVSLITGCSADDVEIYNLYDEFEQPETVLHFETAWGGPITIGDSRACGWATKLEARKALKRVSK